MMELYGWTLSHWSLLERLFGAKAGRQVGRWLWVSVFESLPEWLKTFLLNKATKRERVGVGEVEREREWKWHKITLAFEFTAKYKKADRWKWQTEEVLTRWEREREVQRRFLAQKRETAWWDWYKGGGHFTSANWRYDMNGDTSSKTSDTDLANLSPPPAARPPGRHTLVEVPRISVDATSNPGKWQQRSSTSHLGTTAYAITKSF